jgi:hypothetical protein
VEEGVSSLPQHLAPTTLVFLAFIPEHRAPLRFPLAFASSPRLPPIDIARPQAIVVVDPLPWSRSTVMRFALRELVNGGQLAPNVDGQPPAWIVLPAADREPNPPFGYVVSFVRHHERGFAAPASCFMRGLCYHYGVELHNFTPDAISQAATIVGVCEGSLGIPVN